MGSPANTTSTLVLNLTESFLTGLTSFIDETYRELSDAGFSPEQAWHLEIVAPKAGVQTRFTSGDNVQICAKKSFAVFQSLNVISSYLKANFKDHPSLSSEYINFLASNTGLNQVEKLSSKVKDIQASINLQEKSIKELNKEGNNCKGKIDDLKRVRAIVEQRLKTLEK